MEHIEQQTEFECGVTALQMVTGLSRNQVRDSLGFDPDATVTGRPIALGVSEFDMASVLLKLGYIPVSLRSKLWLELYYDVDGNFGLSQRPLLLDDFDLFALVQRRRALVHTRSLMDGRDVHHWMAWDPECKELLDPATSIRPSRQWASVQVVGVILLYTANETNLS